MIGDAGQHVGQPGLGIDVVELGRDDEPVQQRGALAAAMIVRVSGVRASS